MADNINLSICSKIENITEYMATIRLTTSAVASKIGFDIEEIDDIKVSIGEACTSIIKNGLNKGEESINIEYYIYKDRLTITVKDNGQGCNMSESEDELGIFIIKSLMDEVEISSSQEKGKEIIMTKIKSV